MKISKILIAAACVALFSSLASAEKLFVGGEGGWIHSHGSFDNKNFGRQKRNGNAFDIGVKAGYIINENGRVYGAYRYDFGAKYSGAKRRAHKFLLGYDFTPQVYDAWRAVLGLYGGYGMMSFKKAEEKTIRYRKGFAYGGKVGALYELDANNEVELGFRVEQLRFGRKSETKPTFTDYGLYLGYAYKF